MRGRESRVLEDGNTCEMKDRKEGYKVGEGARVRVLQSKLLDEKQFGEKKLRERNLQWMSE